MNKKANDPISPAEFKVKYNHLHNLSTDKDKIRMIRVIASQYTLEPQQACELIKQVQSFTSIVELCAELQYLTSDEDDFVHDALELCKYPEDRVEMCTMLEVEYIP
ncbi:hypothetical protein BASA81_003371 [Batrachochytrium salamandrivorans]|nr:hypothetical protein BASA81_003371 [Batrachochytrium salamandrivorans]